jgi:hypothetical protein
LFNPAAVPVAQILGHLVFLDRFGNRALLVHSIGPWEEGASNG